MDVCSLQQVIMLRPPNKEHAIVQVTGQYKVSGLKGTQFFVTGHGQGWKGHCLWREKSDPDVCVI